MDESCGIGSSWDIEYSRFIPSLISSMITTQHSFPFPRFMDRNHLSWFDPIQLKQTHPTCRELISNTDCSRSILSFHNHNISIIHSSENNKYWFHHHQMRINSLSTTYQWNGRFWHHPILHSPFPDFRSIQLYEGRSSLRLHITTSTNKQTQSNEQHSSLIRSKEVSYSMAYVTQKTIHINRR